MGLTRQSKEKFIQEAIKEEGSLRKHYNVPEGENIPVAKARADYKKLQKKSEGDKTLSPSDKKLFDRLNLFLQVLKPASKKANNIPGGIGDKKKPGDFDPKQLQKGTKVEREHTKDPAVAKEIAMDHLTEDPAYYKKLEKVEKHAGGHIAKKLPDPYAAQATWLAGEMGPAQKRIDRHLVGFKTQVQRLAKKYELDAADALAAVELVRKACKQEYQAAHTNLKQAIKTYTSRSKKGFLGISHKKTLPPELKRLSGFSLTILDAYEQLFNTATEKLKEPKEYGSPAYVLWNAMELVRALSYTTSGYFSEDVLEAFHKVQDEMGWLLESSMGKQANKLPWVSPEQVLNRHLIRKVMAPRLSRTAKANVTPVRQTSQYNCVAASMGMALRANGVSEAETQTDIVNKVLGALPGRGASWEDAIACAQHYGMRATLVCPATVTQLKNWTDAGIPVLIGWNPEGRPWSHASVVFHVDEDLNIHVADPNIPNPNRLVRVVPEEDFYSKWSEKTADYIIRRPALAIEREITPDGRQVFASLQQNFAEETATPSYEDILEGDIDNSQLPGDGEVRNRKAVQQILRGFRDV